MNRHVIKPLRRLSSGPRYTARKPYELKDFPGFSEHDLKTLKRYYSAQLARNESPEKKVGWQKPESQTVRFEVLSSVGPLEGRKVLDVGCGLGGFLGHLQKQGIRVDYTGIDLFPRVIREAKQHHPGGKFEVRNILSSPYPARSFDYAFFSGVFNIRVKDNWCYMKAVLSAALKQTKKAVAFNILNSDADIRESDRFTAGPAELVAFGRKLRVSRVHLLDHYHHLDLTLFLYK